MKCRMRVVLDHGGSECECTVTGIHDVHRYRDRKGRLRLIRFVPLPVPPPEMSRVEMENA